jgi:broad specificity phosphatase PhoE
MQAKMSRAPPPLFLSLICHGPTASLRRSTFPLDESLDEQARRDVSGLSRSIDKAPVTVASPAKCAMETAVALTTDAVPVADLRDCNVGAWRGRRLAEIEEIDAPGLAAWLSDPDAAPHGGESIRQAALRIASWMDAVPLAGKANAVTHPIIIRLAILHALDLPLESFRKVDVEFLSVTHLVRSDGRWSLRQRRFQL